MRKPAYTLTPVRDRLGEHAYQRFLEANPAGDFMQTLAWGKVKALTGWRSLPLLLQDQDGKVALSALILVRRLPGMPLSMFYAPRGPVLDWTQSGEELDRVLRAFTTNARKLAVKHRAVLMKCDPALPADNETARQSLAAAGFRPGTAGISFEGVQPRFVYAIDLKRPEDQLLASFSSKHRYNVRLAERKGVKIRLASSEEDMAVFYRLLQVTAERDGFGIRTYSYYQAIWREMTAAGSAHLFLAEHEGEVLGGSLIFTLGKRGWYVYGASSTRRRNLMPNYALHWEIMKWLRGHGVEIYDMRGISGDFSPDNPLYGLYRFKKGFSGEVAEFAGEFDLPLIPSVYWMFRTALPAYRQVRRLMAKRRGAAATCGDEGGAGGGTEVGTEPGTEPASGPGAGQGDPGKAREQAAAAIEEARHPAKPPNTAGSRRPDDAAAQDGGIA